MSTLCKSKQIATALVKKSKIITPTTATLLTPGLISGIIKAEKDEMGVFEYYIYDGGGVGPGQMYKPAYTDITNFFKAEIPAFVSQLNSCLKKNKLTEITLSSSYSTNLKNKYLADFYIIAFFGIKN